VRYQQYADDTQLYLSMRVEDAAQGLDTLSACSMAVRDWYLVNHLLLNGDKSQVIVLGTANQLRSASDIDYVQVAGASLSTSRRRTGSTADFPRPRHRCRQVMQLPHSSHQTYPPPAYSVGGPDVSLQFGKQSARLL